MRQPASRVSRWRAAGALIVGGALAFSATFLPFGQLAWPAISGEPATTIVDIPGRDLATSIGVQAHYLALASSTCLLIGGLWGAPLILLAIGVVLFLARRWMPTGRTWASALLLIFLGAGVTVLYCAAFLFFPHGEVIQPKATLQYGPGVALLGYLLALVGVIWTARLRWANRYSGTEMTFGQGGV